MCSMQTMTISGRGTDYQVKEFFESPFGSNNFNQMGLCEALMCKEEMEEDLLMLGEDINIAIQDL